MMGYTDKIREIAKKILTDKTVDLIIGFKRGTLPMMTEPVIIRDAEKTEQLHWDSFCNMNLANYLPKREEKIGIIAKGCDSRNIAVHLVENQIKREQLYIIGVPCEGMVERRKIRSFLGDQEVRDLIESDGEIIVKGEGFEHTLKRNDYLQDNCMRCMHRNPVISDVLIGDAVEERKEPDPYDDVKDIEGMGSEEKWEFFSDLIKDCTRCYACRNACPLCYCPTCFVDESDPQWVGKSIDPTDTITFHILRAYHCAGRCTDCGACEQACPVDIKVRSFTRKLNKDVLGLYGCEAGLTIEERPPLDTYRPDDYDAFIR
ncbi:MAG: Coenzyme F420 hydrogenase/dehydrogenase, beta subunit C-terminal domain [Deltaproteobacteria bacterium]|nr:MAG: Coenzyme F420 hydrogenase/dehydrogenase, beta subunit C-terminal domain [Deltaproteobacteria bacterium]